MHPNTTATAPARAALVIALLLMGACTGVPEGVDPVTGFDGERYLGRWYELARLDHGFERGLSSVTASYRRRDDGSISVLNRGFDTEEQRWKEAEGVARFVGESDVGHLKVSFFGPFYGSYIVFELDIPDYGWAFVSGYNRDYLWLLSRSPIVTPELRARFLREVTELGFPVDELIWVDHSLPPPD